MFECQKDLRRFHGKKNDRALDPRKADRWFCIKQRQVVGWGTPCTRKRKHWWFKEQGIWMETGGCWRHAGNSWISGEFPRVGWVRRPQRESEMGQQSREALEGTKWDPGLSVLSGTPWVLLLFLGLLRTPAVLLVGTLCFPCPSFISNNTTTKSSHGGINTTHSKSTWKSWT